MRIVRSPEGEVGIDPGGRATGRGAYVCRAAECIDNAIKKGALNRALGTPLPTDLREALMAGVTGPTNATIEGGVRGQE